MSELSEHPSEPVPRERFMTTRWSMVLAAGERTSPESQSALTTLLTQYWYPLYVFVRRRGFDSDEAQDLTQAFFARLIEKDSLRAADPQRGRFRSFLLASVDHFLSNHRDRQQSLKRGGGQTTISLDLHSAERRYQCEPVHHETAEKLFDRSWALAVLERALERLRDEYAEPHRTELFGRLKPLLVGDRNASSGRYADLARELRMSESAIKVAVHRMRKRFRDLLHAEIAHTVASPAEIEDEIRALFLALQS